MSTIKPNRLPGLSMSALAEITRRSAAIGRPVDMWPMPDASAEWMRKREAVRAVLAANRLPEITDQVADSIIAAATTGI